MDDSDEISRAKEEVRQHAEMYRERGLTVQLSLWNTLVAFDGLMIGVAAVLVAFGHDVPVWCPLAIVAVSITSLVLLTFNFYGYRKMYRILGSNPPDSIWESSAAWEKYAAYLHTAHQDSKDEQKRITCRENLCAYLAAASLIFFLIGIVWIYIAHRHVNVALQIYDRAA